MDVSRREFITKIGYAAFVTTVVCESGLIHFGCQTDNTRKLITTKEDFEVAADPQFPKVSLARNANHAKALRTALDGIGGVKRFIKEGEKVLLKPNAAFDRVPEQAVNTNPVLIGEMTKLCLNAGASEVIVTDHGGLGGQHRVFSRSGIKDAVEQNGGRIVYLDESDFLETNLNGKLIKKWPVLKQIFEVDRLINMPIAKHHDYALGTASMKNFFGAIGGNRGKLHDQLDQAIVDLASYFRPTLTVVDATRVLMNHGPVGGSLGDVKLCNSVLCATDQVAADSRACEFIGRDGREISYITLAAEQGLGKMDYKQAGYVEFL